jgi:hypothetical protein
MNVPPGLYVFLKAMGVVAILRRAPCQCCSVTSPASIPQQATAHTVQDTSGMKRSSAEIIDLTMEDTGQRMASATDMGGFSSDRTKKHDSKETPSSKAKEPYPASRLPHGMNIPPTPASDNTPMSVLTPHGRATPPPLDSYHPPSIHRSPISWAADGRSPISNLAMRPEYQFGPEDSHAEAQVPLTQPPALDDSLFSDDNQSQDITDTLSNEPHHTDDVPQPPTGSDSSTESFGCR